MNHVGLITSLTGLPEHSEDETKVIISYVRGSEQPLAMTSKALLAQVRKGRTIVEAGELPPQLASSFLKTEGLARYALSTGLLEPSKGLMDFAASHGCLAGMQVLRALDPPCPWDEKTCAGAAKEGLLPVLQWLRRQVPPCP